MTCSSPFKVKIPDTGHIVDIPCGHCTGCRIQRSREWAARIIHEMVYFKDNVFICLTYDKEHLPSDNSISKKELQCYFKRLRKDIYPKKIRYFACGEYGDLNGRPHYHAIIFGLNRSEEHKKIMNDNWLKGNINFGTVTFQSARYVSSYVLKKYNGERAIKEYGDKQIPFALMSKGLGKKFALDNQNQLTDQLGYTINGSKCGLPRYYRNLIKIDKNEFISEAIKSAKETIKIHAERNVTMDGLSVAIANSREQNGRTLEAKNSLYKKGTL